MAKKKGIKSFVGNMIGFHDKEDEEKKSQTVLGGYDIKVEDSSKVNKPNEQSKKDEKPEEKSEGESSSSDAAGDATADKKSKSSGKAPANEEMMTNEVFVGTNKIQAQLKEPAIEASLDIVDTLAKYDKENLPLAAAQLFATNGKTLNRKLADIIQFAIRYNAETRAFISREIPGIIAEYPEQLQAYSVAVNRVASDIRIKHLFYCPIDRNLYDSEDLAFEHLGKSDIIALTRGVWSFADAWVRTDSDGKIIEQDGTLTESEVRNLISGLPRDIQAETADKLHIKWGKKQDNKQDKPDEQDSSGKDAEDDAKDGDSNNRKSSGRGGKKSPKQS
ncbi:hypothetical protein IKE88_00360 [Candidatus Saccharibacteria bacterium]|nr:hypothetical protein [Candidatus Saccharibacteria bacterium]